jgi:hypothetical protein
MRGQISGVPGQGLRVVQSRIHATKKPPRRALCGESAWRLRVKAVLRAVRPFRAMAASTSATGLSLGSVLYPRANRCMIVGIWVANT